MINYLIEDLSAMIVDGLTESEGEDTDDEPWGGIGGDDEEEEWGGIVERGAHVIDNGAAEAGDGMEDEEHVNDEGDDIPEPPPVGLLIGAQRFDYNSFIYAP